MSTEGYAQQSMPQGQLETLGKRYEQQPLIRALVQLIPFGIGSAADVALTSALIRIREDRARTFFDELAKGKIALTQEQITNEDFLHAYFATARAALNTRRREKVKVLGRLFANYCKAERHTDTDNYEELLAIIDDLTLRELHALLILRESESYTALLPGENRLQRATRFWNSFLSRIETEVGVSKSETPGFLQRLNRTGLYQTFVGGMWDYEGDKGCTTANFENLLKFLQIQNADDFRSETSDQL